MIKCFLCLAVDTQIDAASNSDLGVVVSRLVSVRGL